MTQHDETRHARFDEVRRSHPVWFDAPSRFFVLTRMAEARAWLSDASQWKDADQAEEGSLVRQFKPADMNATHPGDRNAGIGWMDDPDHARVRRPIQAALVKRVAAMRPEVDAIVRSELDRLPAGAFDVVADYAMPIPIAVIGALLGVDTDDLDRFRAWSEAALGVFSQDSSPAEIQSRKAAGEALIDFLDAAMAERRARPRDDLISDLLAEQTATGSLSDGEIRINCLNLLVGGNVTTADLISAGVSLLLRHPDQLARLRADPGLIGPAVEEILRLEPPSDGTQRVASRDLEIAGCPVRARQVVAVIAPAANRDPAVFPDPHRFDIGRRDGAHISFGAGAHICIGAPLARLEAKTAIWEIIRRFPDLRLAAPDQPPQWRPDAFFHGLAELRVLT